MQTDQRDRLTAALAGRYVIERGLVSGGMATVYLAHDVKHHREVALNGLRPELAAALGPDRFLREVEIAARLNHPHILALYDSGETNGFLFYVMPYVAGESLRHRLEREKQLPIEEALAITRHIASALGHAHAQHIIHRDVKPENILLYEGEAMVADFGIALAVSAAAGVRLTQTGLAVGTPAYMSPEQAVSERALDARSDVYSLGCVLYEMLAGEPPYTGATAQVLIAKRLVDPVPAVRRLRAAVPVGVEQALTKALAKVPADRWASALAFAEALATPAGPRPPSVAVLPFLNLSADPENEYFADGITEDVIAHLSKIRALKVISRTSVMAFKQREQSLREIGARLEVATLLEAACGVPASGCGSWRSSSTQNRTDTSGPRRTTVGSPMSSRSRRTWLCRSRPRSRRNCLPMRSRASTRSPRAICKPTSCICKADTVTCATPRKGVAGGSSTSSRQSPRTPTTPWRTPPSPWSIRSSQRPARCGRARPTHEPETRARRRWPSTWGSARRTACSPTSRRSATSTG